MLAALKGRTDTTAASIVGSADLAVKAITGYGRAPTNDCNPPASESCGRLSALMIVAPKGHTDGTPLLSSWRVRTGTWI
jgi:hypothetical protein